MTDERTEFEKRFGDAITKASNEIREAILRSGLELSIEEQIIRKEKDELIDSQSKIWNCVEIDITEETLNHGPQAPMPFEFSKDLLTKYKMPECMK